MPHMLDPSLYSHYFASDLSSPPALLLPSSVAMLSPSTAHSNGRNQSTFSSPIAHVLLPSIPSSPHSARELSPHEAAVHRDLARLHRSHSDGLTRGHLVNTPGHGRPGTQSAPASTIRRGYNYGSRHSARNSQGTTRRLSATAERSPNQIRNRRSYDTNSIPPSNQSYVRPQSDPPCTTPPRAYSPVHVYNVYNINVNSQNCNQSFS